MKIAIVTSFFYPWIGGITEHVYCQYRELRRRGHTVHIVTPFDGGGMVAKEDLIRAGVSLPVPANGSISRLTLPLGAGPVLTALLETGGYDVIHLHQPLFCLLSLALLRKAGRLKKRGRPVPRLAGTFHAAGEKPPRIANSFLGRWLRKWSTALDCRIAVSPAAADYVRPLLDAECVIIPNGVDVARFRDEPRRIPALDDGRPNIVYIGRLEPRKGVDCLLAGAALIHKYTSRDFRLVLAGGGVYLPRYRRQVPDSIRDRTVFAGPVLFPDVPRYYKSAAVFCSLARYGESFGIVLIEAMAAGVPVVAGDNPGYRCVVQSGVNGIIVNPVDPEAVARTLSGLLENTAERERLVRRGSADCLQYDWPAVIDRVEEQYRRMLKTGAKNIDPKEKPCPPI
jgi:phosphatidylinositol alpha-mannosyltransferase